MRVKHKIWQAFAFNRVAFDITDLSGFAAVHFEYTVWFQIAQKFCHFLTFLWKIETVDMKLEQFVDNETHIGFSGRFVGENLVKLQYRKR